MFSIEWFMFGLLFTSLLIVMSMVIQYRMFDAIDSLESKKEKEIYDPYYSGGLFNPYDGPHGPCFRDVDRYKKN